MRYPVHREQSFYSLLRSGKLFNSHSVLYVTSCKLCFNDDSVDELSLFLDTLIIELYNAQGTIYIRELSH